MKLTIITINKNNVDGLAKTIRSVLSQNFTDDEFIIIDGGSSDGSYELIKKNEDRLTFWSSQPDSGIYNAMNKGIKKATGEYCLFVNSGDMLCNDNVLTNIIKQNLSEDIISGNALVDEKGKSPQIVKAPKEISFYIFFQHTILHQVTLIRSSLFEDVGYYNEDFKIVADWEFFIKALFLYQSSYKAIDVTISIFDNNGISSRPENLPVSFRERDEVLQKYFPYLLSDYRLLQPRSTFDFLHNIKRFNILRIIFILTSRIINKLFKIFFR